MSNKNTSISKMRTSLALATATSLCMLHGAHAQDRTTPTPAPTARSAAERMAEAGPKKTD